MESSRVFIKNLPPNIKELDLRKHFSTKGDITSIKLIPDRQIAFIGYKDAEIAARAAKFYNRTFIRLSKVHVELARPLGSVPQASLQRPNVSSNGSSVIISAPPDSGNDASPSKKRKRDPAEVDIAASEPPLKTQAISRNEEAAEIDQSDEGHPIEHESSQNVGKGPPTTQSRAAPFAAADSNVEDDEWLRLHTNRVLDLVDPGESGFPSANEAQAAPPPKSNAPPLEDTDELQADRDDPEQTSKNTDAEVSDAATDLAIEKIRQTGRLYVRNLPYDATESQIRDKFGSFGTMEEVHLCVNRVGKSKGFAFLHFSDPEKAVDAFQKTDGTDFQGRLLHVLPGDAKRGWQMDDFAISQLPVKQQNVIRAKSDTRSTFRWNELFMSQDAVNASVAARKGVTKSELFDHTSNDAAVKQAIAETEVITEAKKYFTQHGVDLDAFKSKDRSDGTAILVKNFSHGTTVEELRTLYEKYGEVRRVLMPPSGTIAIVDFAHATQAKLAYLKTGYQKFKDGVLFLEKAPKGLLTDVPVKPAPAADAPIAPVQGISVAELLAEDTVEVDASETLSLFVKNLNFETRALGLEAAFRHLDGFIGASVKMKPDPKNPGQFLSMGFGFVQFKNQDSAQQAIKAMDGYVLDGHKLNVRASHRGLDEVEMRKKKEDAEKKSMTQRKIVFKNLPFQTTKKDLSSLVKEYGKLKSLRVPQNMDRRARGFAFAEFVTPKDALNVFETLQNTHFLGRKLVLEWAEAESESTEALLAKMQEKTSKQLHNITIHQIKGQGGRRRVELNEDEDPEAL